VTAPATRHSLDFGDRSEFRAEYRRTFATYAEFLRTEQEFFGRTGINSREQGNLTPEQGTEKSQFAGDCALF